ncbi:MAG TPA: hypothetical protein VGZ22_11850, partial [Isosphaeraceae bacterium]|nr:hypothetical protein [Isosphaeraceae bacterium]
MIRALLSKRIDSLEKELSAPADYLRHILSVSLRSFFAFAKIGPLASYRRKLPIVPCHVAKLVATRHEDCGTCVQIGVNMAKKEGVSAEVLRAVLDRRPDDLPEELADVYRFTEAVVETNGQEDEYRERIRAHY